MCAGGKQSRQGAHAISCAAWLCVRNADSAVALPLQVSAAERRRGLRMRAADEALRCVGERGVREVT